MPDDTPWNVARTERITYGEHDWSPGEAFVQWKGTDVCFDFICLCGEQGHFDGFFAYAFQCPKCGQVYEFPCNITALAVGGDGQPEPDGHEPVVLEMDEDDDDKWPTAPRCSSHTGPYQCQRPQGHGGLHEYHGPADESASWTSPDGQTTYTAGNIDYAWSDVGELDLGLVRQTPLRNPENRFELFHEEMARTLTVVPAPEEPSDEVKALREDALQRVAIGLDVPPDIVGLPHEAWDLARRRFMDFDGLHLAVVAIGTMAQLIWRIDRANRVMFWRPRLDGSDSIAYDSWPFPPVG